jgi:hypothetical protein
LNEEPRKNAGETRGKPFEPGNPGRPPGSKHKATLAVEALLEGEAEAIGRKCVDLALGGDTLALRLVLERIAPVRRGRPVCFALPPLDAAADLSGALGAVLAAVASGELTTDEASSLAGIIEMRRRSLELVELEQRIGALEQSRRGDQ